MAKLFIDHILFQQYIPFKVVCFLYIGGQSSFIFTQKTLGKNRTNQKQYNLKIRKILRTASLGSNFTGAYKRGVYLSLNFIAINVQRF